MKASGLPEKFWIVTEPPPFSTTDDICFACTYGQLMRRALGGLREGEIVGVFADEMEARKVAGTLLGHYPVRPEDVLAVEVLVHVMVIPESQEMNARELAQAAVEAVGSAVRQAEAAGFRHGLRGRISLGAGTVELRNQTVVPSS